jgi:alpha-D-ribose 1-methylphosphonate 5-triphosphate synthase subunit PhnH
MFSTAEAIGGGFADPVFDAQSVFRAVMDAMARPGTIAEVSSLAAPPAPLSGTAVAVALTLCDHDTPLWLDAPLAASEAVRAYLAFHSGAPCTDRPADAAFALVTNAVPLTGLGDFAQGTQEYPDRSTTLILQVETLSNEVGSHFTLEGPGIETTAWLSIAPLPPNFIAQWQENRARFPRGVDLILAAPGKIACLPRTVRIVEG